ncbi:uncharacterized protein N7477_001125 [Penicillium maclennaniae]|uniref:uncharacterized protein n=1 Tax=Penicillium maclennaniae TaxID=1343394 RepID=UPI0025401BAD|nr:uncharacterized protein N7477_001125 [Penicillium maclennaniae]KAJ5684780.1 hypothetical protein N7477_001125 [Penicillium maclennaniae]
MRAKEDAKHSKSQDKIQDAIPRQGSNTAMHVQDAGVEHPVISPAIPAAMQSEEMEEIPIAGRTKMTIPKVKDAQDSSLSDSMSNSEPERQGDTTDHLEAKSELNSILKQSPGMLVFCSSRRKLRTIEANECAHTSDHLLQILLPLQQESKVDPP